MRNNSPLEASEELLLSQVGAAGFEPHGVADPKRGVVPELVDARRGTRGRAAWCGLSRGKWRRLAFNPRRQTRRVFVLQRPHSVVTLSGNRDMIPVSL